MFEVILLIAVASVSGGTELDAGDNTHLHQGAAAFGYEILEHQLDNLQNSIFTLFTSLEKAEKARLESHYSILEQLQKGITVTAVHRNTHRIIEDCTQADASGRYVLSLSDYKTFAVICETETLDGGWIIIQQRINGKRNFNRNWEAYKNGFGSIGKSSEFWLGLEKMHQITKNDSYELAVELKDESGKYGYILYSNFKLAGEDDHYRLDKTLSLSEGNIYSRMRVSAGEKFSTYDVDNDKSDEHCGAKYKSGWWFYDCTSAYKGDLETYRGIFWREFTYAATYSRMMIRRV